MTTHAFNRKVYVSGPFVVRVGNEVRGYVQIENFELDRTDVDTAEGPNKMKDQLEQIKLDAIAALDAADSPAASHSLSINSDFLRTVMFLIP